MPKRPRKTNTESNITIPKGKNPRKTVDVESLWQQVWSIMSLISLIEKQPQTIKKHSRKKQNGQTDKINHSDSLLAILRRFQNLDTASISKKRTRLSSLQKLTKSFLPGLIDSYRRYVWNPKISRNEYKELIRNSIPGFHLDREIDVLILSKSKITAMGGPDSAAKKVLGKLLGTGGLSKRGFDDILESADAKLSLSRPNNDLTCLYHLLIRNRGFAQKDIQKALDQLQNSYPYGERAARIKKHKFQRRPKGKKKP